MSPKDRQKTRNRIFTLLWLLLVLFLILTAATYTWFSLSKTPMVSDMSVYINSNVGLELSWDSTGDDWGQHLSFDEVQDEMAPLKPVTYSYTDDTFYAAAFGYDGRISGISETLNDARNANKNNSDGYYLKVTFYARTGEEVRVSLMPAAGTEENREGAGTYLIGTPIWNGDELIHDNGGSGAEYAIRMGIRITKTDLTGEALEDNKPEFYIYEPNCDRHINGDVGYIETSNINGGLYSPEDRLILQTASLWSEVSPAERTAVIYDFGEFTSNTDIFTLTPDELAQIDVYIWLEGQDVDCINKIGHDAQILTNIQFFAEAKTSSGLQPIE